MTYINPEPMTQDNTALVLVDHQVGLMTGVRDYPVAELKHNVVGLAKAAKALGLPIITTTTSAEMLWGPAFPELVAALPGHEFIDRTSVNAWDDPRVAAAIEATGRQNLIFAGVSLEVCAAFPAMTIIICGLSAEVFFRGPLVDFGSVTATAGAVREAVGYFRLAIAADIVMAVADAALAILLYLVFRPVAPVLALAAMVFRLIQSVMIAMNLMHMQSAILLITAAPGLAPAQAEAMALHSLSLHAHGYDLGLVFFGINSLLTGYLIWLSTLFPRVIGGGIFIAGLVYLTGSALRFFAPELFDSFAPAYGVTILAEGAFCLILLLGRTGQRRMRTA